MMKRKEANDILEIFAHLAVIVVIAVSVVF
jgi:hypothetical protein